MPLVDHATLFLQATPGTDGWIFLAMAHVILREGWADTAFIETRTEGFEAFAHGVEPYTPQVAALASGVPAEHIEQAARYYALGERADGALASPMMRGRSTILYAMGITQRHNGTELVLTLANLAMLCGQIGQPSTGVNPLRGQSNVQGACDMGALPNVLPGYQPVGDATARQRMAQAWGRRRPARHPRTHGGRDDACRRRGEDPRHVYHGREPYAVRSQHHAGGGGVAGARLSRRAGHLSE